MAGVTMWNCDFSEQIRNLSVNNSNGLDKTLDQFMLFIVSHSQPFTKKSFPFSGVIHHLFCVSMNRNWFYYQQCLYRGTHIGGRFGGW